MANRLRWGLVLTLVIALIVVLALAAGLFRSRHVWSGARVPEDVDGVRSTLVIEVAAPPSDAVLLHGVWLDAITHGLEAARIEVSPWRTDADGAYELGGLVDDDPFLVTLGPIGGPRWQLHVYAQPLGGPRYVAPPRTDTMRRLLVALDRAVRSAPHVRVIGWQRRQDSFEGEPLFYEAPTD